MFSAITPTPHAPAWIALGANLGNARATLQAAIRALALTPGVHLEAVSTIRVTDPLGPTQPRFHNAVVRVGTTLPPAPLLAAMLAIENAFFRRREQHWGPRTLDLDLLLHGPNGQTVCALPQLQLPHPQLHLRTFVLQPLLELDPHLAHPLSGLALAESLRALISAPALV
jgi:2-amino-4-hydroxy-6-hydroxymethyldihydropteridine diphosphokinase